MKVGLGLNKIFNDPYRMTFTMIQYANNWKNFFLDHQLDDDTQREIWYAIDNAKLEDFQIVVTNYNPQDLEEGPRPYSVFKVGSVNTELHCCGYFFDGEDLSKYEPVEQDFYKKEIFSIQEISKLIFSFIFEESEESVLYNEEDTGMVADPKFKHFFKFEFINE